MGALTLVTTKTFYQKGNSFIEFALITRF